LGLMDLRIRDFAFANWDSYCPINPSIKSVNPKSPIANPQIH
jgi:hypothetical protein